MDSKLNCKFYILDNNKNIIETNLYDILIMKMYIADDY